MCCARSSGSLAFHTRRKPCWARVCLASMSWGVGGGVSAARNALSRIKSPRARKAAVTDACSQPALQTQRARPSDVSEIRSEGCRSSCAGHLAIQCRPERLPSSAWAMTSALKSATPRRPMNRPRKIDTHSGVTYSPLRSNHDLTIQRCWRAARAAIQKRTFQSPLNCHAHALPQSHKRAHPNTTRCSVLSFSGICRASPERGARAPSCRLRRLDHLTRFYQGLRCTTAQPAVAAELGRLSGATAYRRQCPFVLHEA